MHYKTQNNFLKFSIHLIVRKSRENYRQIYGKSKESFWRNLSTCTPPIFLGQSFALQLQVTVDTLFRTAVLRKLFDIRFSYKHCNFSHVCLLAKMASKTVTRSIRKSITSMFISSPRDLNSCFGEPARKHCTWGSRQKSRQGSTRKETRVRGAEKEVGASNNLL